MADTSSKPRPSDRWIPWYIFGFFILLVAVLVPMCIIAVRTNTGVVTDNAYDKGLAYNKNLQAGAQQESLKWRGDLALVSAEGKLHVDFHLADADKKPLDHADVKLWLVRPTQAGMDQTMRMDSYGDGHYHAEIAPSPHGLWEARISATVNGHNYQTTRRVVLP